jgi:hypothetical protein
VGKILGFWGLGLTNSPGEMNDGRPGLLLIKLVGSPMDGTMGREALGSGWGLWLGRKITRIVFKWSPKLLIVDEEDGVLEVIWKSFLLSCRIGIDIFNDLLVSGNDSNGNS